MGAARGRVSRFGMFELDAGAGELRKAGRRVRLQSQPFQVLALLVDRAGAIVTRDELQRAVWAADTFVAFDAGLNTAVKKIREALNDAAENPRFIETVPRQGYRFVAPVHYLPATDLLTTAPAPETPPTIVGGHDRDATDGADWAAGWRRYTLPSLGLVLVLASAAIAWMAPGRAASEPLVARLTLDLPPDTVLSPGFGPSVAISPDGRIIALQARRTAGTSQVFWRSVGDVEWHPLAGTEGLSGLVFSPDGTSLAGFADGRLRVASLDGRVRDLASVDVVGSPLSTVWGTDGHIYFAARPQQRAASADADSEPLAVAIWRVASDGSNAPQQISTDELLTRGRVWLFPNQLLPGGRFLIYTAVRGPRDRQIMSFDLLSKQSRELVAQGMGARVVPSGHLVYYSNGQLFAAPFDAGRAAITGPPRAVVAGVRSAGWSGADAAVSDTGTAVYVPQPRAIGDRTLVWVDMNGREAPFPLAPGPYEPLSLSPDGTRLLLTRFDPAADTWSLDAYDLTGHSWTRLADGASLRINAVWTPSGRDVIFSSDHDGRRLHNLFVKPVNPPGAETALASVDLGQYPQAVTVDGQAVLLTEGYHPETGADVAIQVLAPGGRREAVVATPQRDAHAAVSPDGRWLAYASGTRQPQVFVRRFPGAATAVQIANTGGEAPLWSPNGREIYYRTGKRMMAVAFDSDRPGDSGSPRVLFEGDYLPANSWFRNSLLSPDGKRFLLVKEEPRAAEVTQLHVVLGWFDELRQLVPR
jgi:DNA-binding winged helix-turn-helix (wHTH) protein